MTTSTAPDAVELVRATLREQLQPLVDELAGEVIAELVAERVAANGNGAGSSAQNLVRSDRAEKLPRDPKTCRTCGQQKELAAFERGRAVCRDCRRERARGYDAKRRQNGTAAEAAPAFPPPGE